MKIKLHFLYLQLCLSFLTNYVVETNIQYRNRLPQMYTNRDLITLSGFSSGGTFAQQLQISHSRLFSGIGVFSAGYYRCGPGNGNLTQFNNACTRTRTTNRAGLWDSNLSLQNITEYFRLGLIDNPINLRNKRLYIYVGTRNIYSTPDQSLRILNIYEPFIQNPEFIRTRIQDANFSLPSNSFGTPCTGDSSRTYYISNCGFSGPLESLSWLLANNSITLDQTKNIQLQPLHTFDQTEFGNFPYGPSSAHLDSIGFFYVPSNCLHNHRSCSLHFYFHGCFVGREFVGDNHIRRSGFLEIAELNNIIMIFPQSHSVRPANPNGCWDTYGFTGPLYATKQGVQVEAVRQMLSRILGDEWSEYKHHGHFHYDHGYGHTNYNNQEQTQYNEQNHFNINQPGSFSFQSSSF